MKYKYQKDLLMYSKIKLPLNNSFFLKIINRNSDKMFRRARSNKNVNVEHLVCKCSDGYSMKCLLFSPKVYTDKLNLIIFYHGGGFMVKSSKHHFALARLLSEKLNCKVLLPDYRICPEYSYLRITQDAIDVYDYAINNLNTNKILLMGDSAGGNLAIEVAIHNKTNPKGVLLLYPVIDSSETTKSMQNFSDTVFWDNKQNKKMWEMFLKDTENYIPMPKRGNLQDLKNIYIEVAEFDCLRDEGIAFAHQLQDLHVKVLLTETKGTMHAYDVAYKSDFIRNLNLRRIKWIKEYFK